MAGVALFGTDGIRGRYGEFLTERLAERVAFAAGQLIPERSRIIIGRDTRASGVALEGALTAGFIKSGHTVVRIGIIPTPGLAYLALEPGVALAVMITASHNPASDNGIKIFGDNGMKISDSWETQIETWVNSGIEVPNTPSGEVIEDSTAVDRYAKHLIGAIDVRLEGLTVALDCAHGAASVIAPQVLEKLGASVLAIGVKPDGANINAGVGSTHLEALQELVRTSGADIGIAHDGDADRALFVDHNGGIIDGDHVLATLALAMSNSHRLKKSTVVTTVMSNLGFHKAMAGAGIAVEVTAVGDRYVLERLNELGLSLGGEQSGHIIIREQATTGDGILTALTLLALIAKGEVNPGKISQVFESFPQILVNVPVSNKESVMIDPVITEALHDSERELGGSGRLLVRTSGTEQLVRVMAEAETVAQAEKVVTSLVALIRSRYGQ
ncbi:MAG: phosphoglucosamine mutase [Actinobacteria bacterium]|nr:phosphoglucosamine mutase [Actinomycetota bacterium]